MHLLEKENLPLQEKRPRNLSLMSKNELEQIQLDDYFVWRKDEELRRRRVEAITNS